MFYLSFCQKCTDLGLNIPVPQATFGRARRGRSKQPVGSCSLSSLIAHHLAEEELCGYKCGGCGNDSSCTKQYSFKHLPNVSIFFTFFIQ